MQLGPREDESKLPAPERAFDRLQLVDPNLGSANELGFEATCNRDRAMLGSSDSALRRLVQSDGYVFVTDNASDFRPMYARDDLHPGLILMPATVGRDRQQQLTRTVIDWISSAAAAADERLDDYMLNTLVAIDEDGACSA